MTGSRFPMSVVVPSFMQAAYLRDCLESILSEKEVETEVLVFDACSTDGSDVLLEAYRKHLSWLEVESDLGQTHAINKGMLRSEGDVLCYLNSDDVLADGALKQVCAFFESNPDVDFIYGKAQYIDQRGAVLGDYRVFDIEEVDLFGECVICQPATFWRRRVYERIGLFDQSLDYSMDYDYWLRIYQSGIRMKMLDEVLAYSRDYPETKTRSGVLKVYRENFRILMRRRGYLSERWIAGYMDQLVRNRVRPWCWLVPKRIVHRLRIGKAIAFLSRFFARDVHQLTEKAYAKTI